MTSANNKTERPLSPHLQVYKLPMTAKMSISHRISGVILTFGLIALAGWIIAAATGEEAYKWMMGYIQHPLAQMVFLGWAFVLFYHMGNGFRHLFWDLGIGITEKAAQKTGAAVLLFAALATFGLWYAGCDCASASAYKKPAQPADMIEEEQDEVTE